MNTDIEPLEKTNSDNRQIARAAGVIMLGFVLSNITSLVRTMLTANIFGASEILDAFNVAHRFPDILFNLVAGGALASAFIPTLTEFLENDDRQGGWQLISAIINWVIVILLVVCVIAWLFAGQVSAWIAPEFGASQLELTATLLRILLISPVIFGVSGLFMGVLNTYQRFLLPALAPTMYWLGMILGLLFLVPSMGIYGLAWGAVLGSGFHFVVQVLGILKLPDRKYSFVLGIRLPAVREVGRLMAPRLLGVSVVQINFLVNIIIGSGLPGGSISAFDFAFRIMTMPQVVIAQAISIAALPTFSAQIARGKPEEMRSSLAATLRGIIFLSLPATIGLIMLRNPIITLLYERGEFTKDDTELVAWALLWFTVGLIGHSLVEILSRAFYSMHDTKTPVGIGVVAMGLNIVFSFTFPGWFDSVGWMPIGGLALANSLATTLEMIVLLIIMHRRLKGLHSAHIFKGFLKSCISTGLMWGGLYFWLSLTGVTSIWIVGLGGIMVGGMIYFVAMWAFGVPELQVMVMAGLRRIKNFSPRN